jgi:creatinine amidohydrolase
MSETTASAQFELLLPSEIRQALAQRSVVYVPLGTYEWHGEHLPVGLDGLTAHGLCVEAARRGGGLVLPPLYYGTGGEHGAYPWTIMAEAAEIRPLLLKTLKRMVAFDVGTVVILSGHFANEQIEMIHRLEADWRRSGQRMRVRGLAVSMATGLALAPDHAALFETTLLSALWPDRVRIDLLPALAEAPSIDPGGNEMGPQRHDPAHPLFGIFGPDPRRFDPATAIPLRDAVVYWLLAEVAAIEGQPQGGAHTL